MAECVDRNTLRPQGRLGRWLSRAGLLCIAMMMPGCAAAEESLVALGYWVFLVFGVMLCLTVLSARMTQLTLYKIVRKKLRTPATWAAVALACCAAGSVSLGATWVDYGALLLPIGLVGGVAALALLVWARAWRDPTHAVAARIFALCVTFISTLIVLLIYARK